MESKQHIVTKLLNIAVHDFREKSMLVLTELGFELDYEVITKLVVVMDLCIDFNVFISFPPL